MGDALRVPFSQIASVAEGEQFTLLIGLAQGTVVELSRMGAMRTQVLAELRDAHADSAATTASAVGKADIFSGVAGGQPVEIRIYDDALLIIGPASTAADQLLVRQIGAGRRLRGDRRGDRQRRDDADQAGQQDRGVRARADRADFGRAGPDVGVLGGAAARA